MALDKKILNISIQQEHITSLTSALPLCVLLSDEHHIGWYNEHYIKLFSHLDYDNSFECDFIDSLDYSIGSYWETGIIRYSYMPKEIMIHIKNIYTVLKKYINDDTYCILFVDEYSIHSLSRKWHFAHEILIYGYDDIQEIYYGVAFKDNKFQKILVSYDELQLGYENVFDQIDKRGGWSDRMFLQLRPVQHNVDYPFSVHRFVNNLEEYLISNYSDKERYLSLFHKRQDNIPNSKIKEGISIELDFKEYISKLQNDIGSEYCNNKIRYNSFHNLCDHKRLVYNRLQYCFLANSNEKLEDLLAQYKQVFSEANTMRLMVRKIEYLLTQQDFEKAKIKLSKLNQIIEQIFLQEKRILTDIIREYRTLLEPLGSS